MKGITFVDSYAYSIRWYLKKKEHRNICNPWKRSRFFNPYASPLTRIQKFQINHHLLQYEIRYQKSRFLPRAKSL